MGIGFGERFTINGFNKKAPTPGPDYYYADETDRVMEMRGPSFGLSHKHYEKVILMKEKFSSKG